MTGGRSNCVIVLIILFMDERGVRSASFSYSFQLLLPGRGSYLCYLYMSLCYLRIFVFQLKNMFSLRFRGRRVQIRNSLCVCVCVCVCVAVCNSIEFTALALKPLRVRARNFATKCILSLSRSDVNFVAIGCVGIKLWQTFDFSKNATGVFAIFPGRIKMMLRKFTKIFFNIWIIFAENCVLIR